MTEVKICGVTRAEDADLAMQSGARYVGLNFSSKSPRRLDLAAARRIADATGTRLLRVGVFVDESYEEIASAVEAGRLDLVQIHRPLRRMDFEGVARPVIAVVRLGAGAWTVPAEPDLRRCRALLYDTFDPAHAGGTATPFDWSLAASIPLPVPIFLAGGLTAANVGEAIGRARPFAVDVASGVESAPGIKDPEKVSRFMEAVGRADGAVGAAGERR
jgi:phosphoribosylanthranilate isomerase